MNSVEFEKLFIIDKPVGLLPNKNQKYTKKEIFSIYDLNYYRKKSNF